MICNAREFVSRKPISVFRSKIGGNLLRKGSTILQKGKHEDDDVYLVSSIEINEDGYIFNSDIENELALAKNELEEITNTIQENEEHLNKLTPDCDTTDYALALASGTLCGLLGSDLVNNPRDSILGDKIDKWVENRTVDFARMYGWSDNGNGGSTSAIKFLENKFKVPYDQRGAGDAGSSIFDLTPTNHHFKSLGHNPTLLGLVVSILDQFNNTSTFISNGEIIRLEKADNRFELRGNSVLSKLFAGFINWFGHLLSDVSGSSCSKGRGMGIPSPILSWANDVIALKRNIGIPVSDFDRNLSELAVKIFKEGYDARFEVAKSIPVIINELIVRTIFATRRFLKYLLVHTDDLSAPTLWDTCNPFGNASVKRMLTVAHGSFVLVNVGDSVIQGFVSGGGSFNAVRAITRLNIIGIGRFTVSLFGEINQYIQRGTVKNTIYEEQRYKAILEYYIEGLEYLADKYDDRDLVTFTKDLKESGMYKQAFEKTVKLAEKRDVPSHEILRSKEDIDSYFNGGKL